MVLWEGVLWGAFGGFAMEALDYIIAVRRRRMLPWLVGASTLTPDRGTEPDSRGRHVPDELPAPGLLAYGIAVCLRIVVGAGAAAAVVSTSPSASAWMAVVTGAASLLAFEKVTVLVPLLMHLGREAAMAALQESSQTGTRPTPDRGPLALLGTAARGEQPSPPETTPGSTDVDQEGV
ncbi:hypothetical protein AB5J56_40035 [Streptomyces sp. R21]|uniref:Uncharacterized protein n=1 Tax=Streptomyces sp. R21 TaxID=3238627 RepID=A0AB39PIZ7_9ACTN